MDLSHCRSCAAPIIWTVTTNGKRMPVDADPVVSPRGFRLDEGEDPPVASFTTKHLADDPVYVSHFSTCPNADAHRL